MIISVYIKGNPVLSNTAEYALRAVLHVAENAHETESLPVVTVAKALGIPKNYLSKILHELARAGVLASTRGKHGGFRLGRAPSRITLFDVVSCFDEIGATRRCLLGRPQCNDRHPCVVHDRWKDVAQEVASFFRHTTLTEVISEGATVPALAGGRESA